MEQTTVIEINGVKMEVDLRSARRVDNIRVGTKVKLLVKSDYGEPKVHTGVVVGFEPFAELPTIIVCYLETSYASCDLKFAYINSKSSKQYDMVVAIDDDLPVKKADVLTQMERQIEIKKREIEEVERKRDYFLQHFNAYFPQASAA